jgi:hypothetical protein
VPGDAAWCTLCFAQLRVHAAELEPTAAAPEPVAMPQPVPFAAPVLSVPVATAVVEPVAATWPCSSCSELVSLEAMACPCCGTAFMGGVNANVSLKVPVVGELVGMSGAAKFGVMAGGATLFTTLLLLVLVVLGHLF